MLGAGEAAGALRLEEIVRAAHAQRVPVLVDAAAEWPESPDLYLTRGADLVAYSGGKIYRGPQCAGFLLGRRDLIHAARLNSAPHHAYGRMMKVGKEEIMGALAALEVMHTRRKRQEEAGTWNTWLTKVGERLGQIPGVSTKLAKPAGTNPHPFLRVSWDPTRIALTADELHDELMAGELRVRTLASGDGHSFNLRVSGIEWDEVEAATARLQEVFARAPQHAKPGPRPPATNLTGRWSAELVFVRGSARHQLFFETEGNELRGTYQGRSGLGEITGTIDGDRVRFRTRMRYEGANLEYLFTGQVHGGEISGEVDLGEYGRAQWRAQRSKA
jgi:L-seryl-tRNA(Ser) seleniumtransferase